MHDGNSPHPTSPNHYYDPPTWWRRLIAEIKRRLEERRTKYKHEGAQDKAARKTASATVWIALFAFVTIGLGAAQFFVLRGQLRAMQGQLDEMKAGSSQTDRALEMQSQANATAGFQEAVTSRIANNARDQADYTKRLADISDKELKVAQTNADAARVAANALSGQLKAQQTALRLEHRPRIVPIVFTSAPLVITAKSMGGSISVSYKNFGNLAAENLEQMAMVWPLDGTEAKQQLSFCEMADGIAGMVKKDAKGEPVPPNYRVDVSEGDQYVIGYPFSTDSQGGFSKYVPKYRSGEPADFLTALFVGCVSWVVPGDVKRHHYRFMYMLREIGPDGYPSRPKAAAHTVPLDKFTLIRMPSEGNGED